MLVRPAADDLNVAYHLPAKYRSVKYNVFVLMHTYCCIQGDQCEPFHEIDHSMSSAPNVSWFHDVVLVQCERGYAWGEQLDTEVEVRCNASAQWEPAMTECTGEYY